MARARAVVLRALGLGDLLTVVPALRAVRRGLPDHEVVLLAPRAFAPLVRHADLADRLVHVDAKDRLPPTLPTVGDVDVAIGLHGRGPESHRLLLALGPRRLVAFSRPPVHEGAARWEVEEHEVHRWARLLGAEGLPADPTDLSIAPPRDDGAAVACGATVLHPGASAAARRWPAARWVALARAERAAGRRVVLTAGRGEGAAAARIASHAGLAADAVIEPRDVLALFGVLGAADAVVVGDTGVAHVATATGTPSVVLFGPTSPARWGPPRAARHRVLWSGRQGDPHAERTDPGLLAIGVDDVLAELAALRAACAG